MNGDHGFETCAPDIKNSSGDLQEISNVRFEVSQILELGHGRGKEQLHIVQTARRGSLDNQATQLGVVPKACGNGFLKVGNVDGTFLESWKHHACRKTR